jgi:hypothetical protein
MHNLVLLAHHRMPLPPARRSTHSLRPLPAAHSHPSVITPAPAGTYQEKTLKNAPHFSLAPPRRPPHPVRRRPTHSLLPPSRRRFPSVSHNSSTRRNLSRKNTQKSTTFLSRAVPPALAACPPQLSLASLRPLPVVTPNLQSQPFPSSPLAPRVTAASPPRFSHPAPGFNHGHSL